VYGPCSFRKIVKILKEKYGDRLADVVPTEVCMDYLIDDDCLYHAEIKLIRTKIQETYLDSPDLLQTK